MKLIIRPLNFLFIVAGMLLAACGEDEYAQPAAGNTLQNDVIKRTMGPNLVGQSIEFAYAMALPQSLGSLMSAKVEASIAGAPATYLEHRAYYTNSSGTDVPTVIGDPSLTEGTLTQINFSRDTFATTLRYFYVIPEEARGKSVSFKFSATASDGKTVSYSMGPYQISNMDMVLDKGIKDNDAMYISIADMAVYNAAEAAANPEKIDLVYLYRAAPASFAHALVAPATDVAYLPGITLPAGVGKNTKIIKTLNLRDFHLARLQYGVYIDDVDFRKIDFTTASNFALNVRNEGGVWVETEDGQYRAFVYINAISNPNKTMTVSIKRLQM